MKPGCFGESLSTTIVHGRPSAGFKLNSNPCANSAITPMYDFRHHSPSETTSNPAQSCNATTDRTAAPISHSYSSSDQGASSRIKSFTYSGRGIEPTIEAGNRTLLLIVSLQTSECFFYHRGHREVKEPLDLVIGWHVPDQRDGRGEREDHALPLSGTCHPTQDIHSSQFHSSVVQIPSLAASMSVQF